MTNLLQSLRDWRNEQAKREGVEMYRVLSNTVLETLVGALPKNREEMLAIKGIKEAKFRKYGSVLLGIIAKHAGDNQAMTVTQIASENHAQTKSVSTEPETLSVGRFLDALNLELSGMAARIRGEVSSVDIRERVVYFTLKDSEDESLLPCLIFRSAYVYSGVSLAVGDEVIVEGAPDIYKPSGRLSLKVGSLELCGEGALKKAYDALKAKLEEEGIFALEKKRELPKFPTRIALITSEQGAAIGDFTMNLGRQGFRVDFYPTSVEGKRAVPEIMEALSYFRSRAKDYDLLVLIRGGGSFESLQAFNTEVLVRAVADCPIPTLLGVGHEKDITLAALAADLMVSTPTATARTLREPWDEARSLVHHFEEHLPTLFERELTVVRSEMRLSSEALLEKLNDIIVYANTLRQTLFDRFLLTQREVREKLAAIDEAKALLLHSIVMLIRKGLQDTLHFEERLRQYDPTRVLKLGYSLVKANGRIVKDVGSVRLNDILDIHLGKGSIGARVERIITE